MASNVLQNDFTSGIISQRLLGKYNSAAYHNGCLSIENFLILPQGGLTHRPGTLLLNSANHEKGTATDGEKISLKGTRLIPFCLRADMNFVIELGNGTLRVWRQDCKELMRFTMKGSIWTCLTREQLGFDLYTSSEAEEVQFAQDYQHLFLAHENHKPIVITYSETLVDGSYVPSLSFSTLSPTLYDGDEENAGLFEGRDCPGVVFFYAGRLWFARSKAHPFRLWASRPNSKYDYDNFEFMEIVQVVDEGANTKTVEEAVKNGALTATSSNTDLVVTIDDSIWEDKVEESGLYTFTFNGASWILGSSVVDMAQYGITITGTPAQGNVITVRYYNLTAVTYKDELVATEDCALLLEVGGSRNDQIQWMGSMGNNIIVGTSSGEWIMAGNINGLEQNIYQSSSYGSVGIQCAQAGTDIIFTQTGGKKTRGYASENGAYACLDLNFYSGELGSIVHMAWQRVPEPRLYCVMKDGTLAVLSYDRQYGIQGWVRWTFTGKDQDGNTVTSKVKDVCVAESSSGQSVYISIQRGTRINLEVFNELDVMDTANRYDCVDGNSHIVVPASFTTNSFENTSNKGSSKGSSIGNKKRIYRVVARVLNTTSITAGYRYKFSQDQIDRKYFETRSPNMENMDMDDVELPVPGGFEKYVAVTILEESGKPITVTALSLNTEVS